MSTPFSRIVYPRSGEPEVQAAAMPLKTIPAPCAVPLDNEVVHLSGNENIYGIKFFRDQVYVGDSSTYTSMKSNGDFLKKLSGSSTVYTYSLPATGGTLALHSEITGLSATQIAYTNNGAYNTADALDVLYQTKLWLNGSEVMLDTAMVSTMKLSGKEIATVDKIPPIYSGTCSTAANAQVKAVTGTTFTGSTIPTGALLIVRFTNGNTYSGIPQIDLENTGGAMIKRGTANNAGQYEWATGEVVTFVYNGWAWLIVDGELATTTSNGHMSYSDKIKLDNLPYIPYATATISSGRFSLSPSTTVYRITPTISSGACEIPIPDLSGMPSISAYFAFELEITIGSGATTLIGPPEGNPFDSGESYSVGDYVVYSGSLYKCTIAHSGAWNASNFTEISNATLGWEWLEGRGLPASDFASSVLYISCRLDCTAKTVVANVWRIK